MSPSFAASAGSEEFVFDSEPGVIDSAAFSGDSVFEVDSFFAGASPTRGSCVCSA